MTFDETNAKGSLLRQFWTLNLKDKVYQLLREVKEKERQGNRDAVSVLVGVGEPAFVDQSRGHSRNISLLS